MSFKLAWDKEEATGFTALSMDRWERRYVVECIEWCRKHGLPVSRSLLLRMQTFEADLRPPARKRNQSLRAWRKALRKWRRDRHGSIRKMRKATKEQQVKEQRWQMFVEQGLPLRDVEAICWYLRANMWGKDGVAPYGYLHTDRLAKVAGGTLPGGFDFDRYYAALRGDAGHRRAMRERARAGIPDPKEIDPPKKKFPPIIKGKIREVYGDAGFRHKHSEDLTVDVIGWDERAALYSGLIMRDSKDKYRRRGRWATHVTITVKPDWYRKVFLTGKAAMFGPRTFVIDVYEKNGVETFRVARQRSEVRYEVDVIEATADMVGQITKNTKKEEAES
jgi:hypothetical protein